jgi:hypothetical protein
MGSTLRMRTLYTNMIDRISWRWRIAEKRIRIHRNSISQQRHVRDWMGSMLCLDMC